MQSTGTSFRPATEAQLSFLNKLLAERDMPLVTADDVIDRAAASKRIDYVKGLPRPARQRVTASSKGNAPTQFGVYRNATGDIFRVYPARGNAERLLAKKITTDGFEYMGLAARFVTADQRVSVEEAAAYGLQFNVCCVCGAALTDPESVDAGIGPICASKY